METPRPIIALVDDDRIFQLTASRMIRATDLSNNILQFENGEDAIHYLRRNQNDTSSLPDYVFLDINMPVVDGWMFLDDYAALKPQLAKPVVIYVVSSSIDPKDIARARNNADVRDYVMKPVTHDKFRELIQARPGNSN